MSAVRRLSTAAVLALAACAIPALAADEESWITIERATAQRALAAFGAAGKPGALTILEAGRPQAMRLGAAPTEVVVARIRQDAVDELADIIHREFHHCGGFIWHATRESAEREAARANDPASQRAVEPPIPYTIDNGPVVQALLAPIQEINIRNTITSLGAFLTRRHNCSTGLSSATWIRDTWQGLAQGRPDVTVAFFSHIGTPQPSVILTIPGATIPSEVVVLGGHQDSIAGGCTSRSPGEDDDASGVATITEVIRVAMALGYRPQRTVKFMAYAAEEVGLVGSDEIAQSFLNQGVNVVGVVQFDMTDFKGSTQDIWIYTDNSNPAQNTFVGNLVDTYLPGLTRSTSSCGYACSDHASWNSRGYPASLPFEARFDQYDPFIHTSQDTLANCGGTANHAFKFTKLAAAYMAEVGKGCLTTVNQDPVANAGPDQTAGPLMTTLNGSASFDPDGAPVALTYAWTQVSGPRVVILDANMPVARFRAAERRHDYVFRLTVSDGCETATDDVVVHPRPSDL